MGHITGESGKFISKIDGSVLFYPMSDYEKSLVRKMKPENRKRLVKMKLEGPVDVGGNVMNEKEVREDLKRRGLLKA